MSIFGSIVFRYLRHRKSSRCRGFRSRVSRYYSGHRRGGQSPADDARASGGIDSEGCRL